ncbi:PREDICTED: uncharacterized protein LOC109484359 [Branchiostoma belcheri]|uniref:Uncharacterized protein LOC109484359 n=1 Tax=Branchiostoma belcheri TaxID=7741 RepID=A0A6P5AMC0_BRABE|nr:PREDICTED: uncharacterized protein LOC109484359 [Branchiostoma belcheri]
MSDINMTSLANRLQDLELCLKSQHGKQIGYRQALREAIIRKDVVVELEVLKSLGDLHLRKGKLRKDSAEFDKAAALYAAALLRCTDPDVGQTLEHRISYTEKLSWTRQLLQGYSPQYQTSRNCKHVDHNNVLRVAKVCHKLEKTVGESWRSTEDIYTEALVAAIEAGDALLELQILKVLGDFYLEKGKKTSDASQFSKAAAMYNKALTTCGDAETKLTLEHRILYTGKISEAVKRKFSLKTSRQRERSPSKEHELGNITSTVTDVTVTPDQHVLQDKSSSATKPEMTRVAAETVKQERLKHMYEDHLKKGESSIDNADLDSAEQHFAAALKMVHVRDPIAKQYQREVEPLCKLGDVYSKRGQQTGDGGDFVKAAALYNAAIARSEDQVLNGNIASTVKDVQESFLKCILGVHVHNVSFQDQIENHKKQLKEMREQIKLEMETIDQQLDPYVHDEDDPCVKEIEAKRAQAVRQLFENIAQQRKEFISLLVDGCIGLMGPPPCKYALIGLGSQATGLVTPYSDLEFAILVEDESDECLVYFCKITHYLHLKVVNLGETILPALGIKCLNDFYSGHPLDNWYYDSVTPHGFAFDGSMPKASKTPLGRQGTMNDPSSELICTPENMVSLLQKDATLYLKEGYHLASILRNPCLIAGDQDLIDMYMAITVKILQADGGKMARQLAQETLKENIMSHTNKETLTAGLIDVKKELYRFPAVAVDCLALSSGIIPTTVWETIDKMESQQVISPNNAHHLTVLTSISAELRLKTYIANGGQKENLSALASMERQESSPQTNDNDMQTTALIPVFHIGNEKLLFRYYYTAIPLKKALTEWHGKKPSELLSSVLELYDNSLRVQGKMYYELCKYRLATTFFCQALEEENGNDDEKILLLNDIQVAYFRMGDYQKVIGYNEQALRMCGQNSAYTPCLIAEIHSMLGNALACSGNDMEAVRYYEQALQMFRSVYGKRTAHPDIAVLLNSLGESWIFLADYNKALGYFGEALQMHRLISPFRHTTANPDIAILLRNMGMAWYHLNDYKKAIDFNINALQMQRCIYGHSTAHPEIATSLNNLGGAWSRLGDHRRGMSYCEQALAMVRSIYGQDTAHPNIATQLSVIGSTWCEVGDYRKAISYHEQALQMRRCIYRESKAHPDIARSFNNIGMAWQNLGESRIAISYLEQSLQMHRDVYGQTNTHPEIATSLNNIGLAWCNLGDHRKAISYHEQALQMQTSVYGQGTAHSDIASSFGNLGSAWSGLGNDRKALRYHRQALQMCRKVYGQGAAHSHIAKSLSNIGTTLSNLGEYKKALRYLEQAFQMHRNVYGVDAVHSDIVTPLYNLGGTCSALGDHRKALSYFEQALQMHRSMYSQINAHPQTAILLRNLAVACIKVGYHRKAVSYLEEALQMYRTIYGKDKEHTDIATSLFYLGVTWGELGDYIKALSYCEQALQMCKTIAHPDIDKMRKLKHFLQDVLSGQK